MSDPETMREFADQLLGNQEEPADHRSRMRQDRQAEHEQLVRAIHPEPADKSAETDEEETDEPESDQVAEMIATIERIEKAKADRKRKAAAVEAWKNADEMDLINAAFATKRQRQNDLARFAHGIEADDE